MPESVRRSTSRVWATIVSHVPVWETSWPRKKSRKLRIRSERKVSFAASDTRVTRRPAGGRR